MKALLLILSLIFSINILYSQTNWNERSYFENSDKTLNEVYQNLINKNRSDTVFIRNLRISQRAWMQFRDAQVTLIFPNYNSLEVKDSLSRDEFSYLAHLTEERTKILLEMLKPSTVKKVYVSDLELIHSGNINGGIGLDKPYWTDELVICGIKYEKGVVIHPQNDGTSAYAEFLIPEKGGHLLGVAGWAEGSSYADYHGKMRYRIFVDGKLIYGNEFSGKECWGIDLDLGSGKILRLESDDGDDFNYNDHMAFGDLRIIY